MSALFEDPLQQDRYFGAPASKSIPESIQLRVLEWFTGREYTCADSVISSAAELVARDSEADCQLRIVFAPSQASFGSPEHKAVQTIFGHYDVPSAFVSEYFTSPAYSFGERKGLKALDVDVAWTRFLCKDVLSHPGNASEDRHVFYDNFLWLKCISYVHVQRREDDSKCVTMIFFGATTSIEQRFERLLDFEAWMDAVEEPYILFALIYEQCFLMLDKAAWTLATWFRPLERSTLDRARYEHSGIEEHRSTDFAKLHEIAKHAIYLNEAATAAVLEMENLISHLRDFRQTTTESLSQATLSKFKYQMAAFRSTQLRLSSLDKRIANVISLSFNLVTQRDSRLLKQDSNAMKAIALLTLVFLPMTGIASLFDTPFFEVRGDVIDVALSFWVFWVITIVLTLAMIAFWLWWYRIVKRRSLATAPEQLTR